MNSRTSTEDILKTPNAKSFKGFNLKELILSYLKYWYWFVICLLVSLSIAYFSLKYSTPLYDVASTIVISQEDNLSDAGLSVFKDLGLNQSQDKIENEIQILKSKTLIKNVVAKLKLNIQYFRKGTVLDIEEYKNTTVKINFLVADNILHQKYANINVLINSKDSFSLIDENDDVISAHKFGSEIETKIGKAVLTLNKNAFTSSIGSVIKIRVLPIRSLVDNYRNGLMIGVVGQNSSVLQVAARDAVIEKAQDFIDNLIAEYSIRTINNKNETSNKTAQFLNDRLSDISKDLASVDNDAAKYMSKNGVTEDLSGSSGRLAEFSSENKKVIDLYETQMLLVNSTIDFIRNNQSKDNVIPNNLGLDNSIITTDIGKYNTLVLQKKRLLKSSTEQNPSIVRINEELAGLQNVLFESLNSVKNKISIKLNREKKRERQINGKLYKAPKIQKDLREISRDQGVTEQLYLYLLQKKEEADITSHITVPNSRVIDKASPISLMPVSPNRKSTYLLAFVLGLLIPFSVIYGKDLLNTSVKSMKDLEELVSVPVIGTIPKSKLKNQFVIDKSSRTSVSEAFRILKTNLDFLLVDADTEKGKVIFTTSSISGEGKTFISSNIAKTLAISGKKVAYVGTDFRFPKFHEILDLPNGKLTKGFTNFITNLDLSVDDVIFEENSESPISILPPGVIPPNPTGLLTNDRVTEMFNYLKNNFDYIVVDTAPVSLVTDTLLISKFADLTVYVVKENYTDKGLLTIPENYYNNKRLSNLAVLLNHASTNMGGTYGYGYGYNAKK